MTNLDERITRQEPKPKLKTKKNKTKTNEDDSRPKFSTYKYSENGNGELYEAVLIGGKPYFITYDHQSKNIEGCEEFGERFRILRPAEVSEYSYLPYEFKNKKELVLTYLEAKKQNLDMLLSKAESIVSKYNVQDNYKLKAIASDVVWSYFQDRFATTRYEVLVGGVGGGKSALAATFGAIGYRPIITTNPTPAILYRLLGNIEPGQCTMILEEAEKIDQVYEIMAILKTGYTRDGKVNRTNPVTLRPEYFHSYCFKIIVAERSPNQDTAKGVIDRSFIHSCFKGYPEYDIKEVLNPTDTGGPNHQNLLKELDDFRKLLLLYRVIHFKDTIPDINIGITGRDKELVKPTLQLFQGTKSQDKLVETFQKILDLKNRRKATALHAALLSVAGSLVTKKSLKGLDGKVEAYASEFWSELPERIKGQEDEKKPGEYHSVEFGTLYKGTVSKILQDNFGVESRHTKYGSLLTFDCHTITQLESQLNSKITIEKVTPVTPVTAVDEGGTPDLRTNNNEGSTKVHEFHSQEKAYPPFQETSPPSPPSPSVSPPGNTTIYRRYPHSDIWACHNCKLTGDKWFMQKHHCRGHK